MSSHASNPARVVPLRPAPVKEPLWRHVIGDVLRGERLAQERTLKDVAAAARISMPYLSELERGRKEASSEVLAAAAQALGLRLADLLARAQGELARYAEPRPRPRPERAAPRAAADERDGTATSVAELSARPPARARTTPGRGDVRLAA
ncbi:helix-turn-helix domain-containing protein [Streptomyces litchfieldiae]|uniref:Helix-turn-helix transcriptional regulator n=1 Tax=Streptomyces litchfieldiae TaxID=3075543 RepID=A0ABU2MN24_9ACTN|nr:helix-turn-helix transcriptional regulator [Streptomyces sp. DSM 44938]MDT0342338.1 helix-turn-helix transcriptional regulator [Streptomyces sp. DSM 44938]